MREMPSGHQLVGVVTGDADGDAATALSSTCASNPSACSATSTSGRTPSAWRTDNVRCIRLKSRLATPATVPSLLRINASSVGQSILAMDSLVVCPADASSMRTACMPMAFSACSTGDSEGNSCRTAKVRCIRLNSRPTTPARPASLLRISASSVGQSMFSMRYTA